MTTKLNVRSMLLLVCILLGFSLAIFYLFGQRSSAPEVNFLTLDGKKIKTSELRNKLVLVNFWATSCPGCIHEMPQLVELYKKFSARGFEIIAVAMRYDPPNYVAAYAKQHNLPFKVAFDANGDIAQRFGEVRLTPTTFIINKRGQIVQQTLGELDFGKVEKMVEALLNEKIE